MLLFEPVKKLSRQTTSAPELTRRSHRWLPKKPAPPVTTVRLGVMQTTRAGTTRFGCPKIGLGSFGIPGIPQEREFVERNASLSPYSLYIAAWRHGTQMPANPRRIGL